ncbi:MAG: CorA family divalent cation transporter [Oscillospiraceae bacterium]|nr:CorA family divalent cation transporter [Oscillospiraceae bacterium]
MRSIFGLKDIEKLQDYVGFDVYSRLLANRHACIELDNGAFLIEFHFCDVRNPAQRDERVCIYCGTENFVFITDNRRCVELISDIDGKIEPSRQLLKFFSTLTANDVYELEKKEDRITDLEDSLLKEKRSNSDNSDKIISIRRELLKMKRYYEQLALITEDLSENANRVFSEELQKRFVSLDRRMDYLLNSVMHLREYITQVREAYQAQIDIEQNQIMKVFTVITAIFLPLTLIVGWYGMNFSMPEYGWNFGYPYVIALSIVVCVACVLIFKWKKWY